jgi:hypothetical protein
MRYRYRDSNCVANPVTPVFIGVFGPISPVGGSWGQPETGHAAPKMPPALPPVPAQYFEPLRGPGATTPGANLRLALDRVSRPVHLDDQRRDLRLQARPSPTLSGLPARAVRGEPNRFRTRSPARPPEFEMQDVEVPVSGNLRGRSSVRRAQPPIVAPPQTLMCCPVI